MHSGYGTKLNYGKDVLYDFLKNEWDDWSKILSNLIDRKYTLKFYFGLSCVKSNY